MSIFYLLMIWDSINLEFKIRWAGILFLEEMSSCNVEALTMERFTADWLFVDNFAISALDYFLLFIGIILFFLSRSYFLLQESIKE